MGKNIIVSEDTIRDLLEAHASLSAWYYELWSALRGANATADAPEDAARAAFVERTAASFPEVGSIARSIRVPRMFVPPPPSVTVPPGPGESEGEDPPTTVEPAPARLRELFGHGPSSSPSLPGGEEVASTPSPAVPPPPMVVPSQVKYEP
jgi:hypothetical protein